MLDCRAKNMSNHYEAVHAGWVQQHLVKLLRTYTTFVHADLIGLRSDFLVNCEQHLLQPSPSLSCLTLCLGVFRFSRRFL